MDNMLESAQTSIKKAGKSLRLNDEAINKLLTPEKIHQFSISIKLDNGERKEFKAYRVQHNSRLGPYKGGIRFHPNVSREEVEGLATLMTIKSSAIGLNFGGAKGGVSIDPKELSRDELERLSREYVRKIFDFIGPEIDIPAPDLNTNSQIIAWMVDEWVKLKVKSEKLKVEEVDEKTLSYWRAAFTGKPLDLGGIEGRDQATGRGGVIILKSLISKLNYQLPITNDQTSPKIENSKLKIPRLTVAVQGFGNVGYSFAKNASQEGLSVVAVSDSKGGIIGKNSKIGNLKIGNSLDIPLVMECKKEKGYVAGCYCVGGVCDLRDGRQISNEELLELPVDILVPSALENVINSQNMSKIKAKIIIEMANGPISDEAHDFLSKKGAIIIPDILANAGGVVVSHLEWLQNMRGEDWDTEKVNKELEEMMIKAFETIWNRSQKEKISLKQSAFETALKRIFS